MTDGTETLEPQPVHLVPRNTPQTTKCGMEVVGGMQTTDGLEVIEGQEEPQQTNVTVSCTACLA